LGAGRGGEMNDTIGDRPNFAVLCLFSGWGKEIESVGSISTRLRTLCGARSAALASMEPPYECPMRCTGAVPSSIRLNAMRISCSIRRSRPECAAVRPQPMWSGAIRR
jgi:hypothetical protein